jgi:hypothetical protein
MTWRDSYGLGSEGHSKVYIVLAGLEDYHGAYSEGETEHSTISVLVYWYKKNDGGKNNEGRIRWQRAR